MATVSRQSAGVQFDLRTIPPLKQFQFNIDKFVKGISDWGPALRVCGELFKRQMGEQFSTGGAASGKPWKENKQSYSDWKFAHYGTRMVGVRTRALMASMTGGGGYSETIGKTSGSFGMSESSPAKPYGAEFSKIRPVIRVTPRWGTQHQQAIHAWVLNEERYAMGSGSGAVAESVRLGGIRFRAPQNVDLRGTS
jgi:hypothetical protein